MGDHEGIDAIPSDPGHHLSRQLRQGDKRLQCRFVPTVWFDVLDRIHAHGRLGHAANVEGVERTSYRGRVTGQGDDRYGKRALVEDHVVPNACQLRGEICCNPVLHELVVPLFRTVLIRVAVTECYKNHAKTREVLRGLRFTGELGKGQVDPDLSAAPQEGAV